MINSNLEDKSVSRYKQIEKVGGGAYGVVYKALDCETWEYIALKKMIHEVFSLRNYY